MRYVLYTAINEFYILICIKICSILGFNIKLHLVKVINILLLKQIPIKKKYIRISHLLRFFALKLYFWMAVIIRNYNFFMSSVATFILSITYAVLKYRLSLTK